MLKIRLRFFQFLTILLILFQFLDGYFTFIGIESLGVAVEGNPIIAHLIGMFGGFWGLFLPKAFGVLLIVFVYETCKYKITPRLLGTFILLNIFYAWVVHDWFDALIQVGLLW